jgi:hypothetical protein
MQNTNWQQTRRGLKAITWIDGDAASGMDGDEGKLMPKEQNNRGRQHRSEWRLPFPCPKRNDLEGSNERQDKTRKKDESWKEESQGTGDKRGEV